MWPNLCPKPQQMLESSMFLGRWGKVTGEVGGTLTSPHFHRPYVNLLIQQPLMQGVGTWLSLRRKEPFALGQKEGHISKCDPQDTGFYAGALLSTSHVLYLLKRQIQFHKVLLSSVVFNGHFVGEREGGLHCSPRGDSSSPIITPGCSLLILSLQPLSSAAFPTSTSLQSQQSHSALAPGL